MDQTKILNKLIAYRKLLEQYFEVEEIYLFGSYAHGKPRKDSDIDVAVVVKKLSKDYFSDTPLIWKLRRKIDTRIEPVLFEKDKDQSGFLQEIKKKGIEIK